MKLGSGWWFLALAVAAAGCASRPAVPAPTPVGYLAPHEVDGELRRHFGAFRACYDTALERNNNLRGWLNVRFVIGPNGRVVHVEDEGSSVPNELADCALQEFPLMEFPQPKGGFVTVRYPLEFSRGPYKHGPNPLEYPIASPIIVTDAS